MTNTNPTIESIIEAIENLPAITTDEYELILTTFRESFPTLHDND